MTAFWQNWLRVWAIFVALFGLVLAGAGTPALSGGAEMLFATFGRPIDAAWTDHLRFTTALMGAVTLGWGLTYLVAFRALWLLGDRAASIWRALLAASLLWFVVDSSFSILNGFWQNAVSNTAIVIALLVALIGSGVLREANA